jgi:peptidyl-prolyl cis-trans isomerase SurA
MLAVILAAALGPAGAEGIPLDGYAAKVHDRVITVGDVLKVLEPVERQLRQKASGLEFEKQMEEAYEQALEALIERALVVDDFEQRGGTLPDTAVDSRIEETIRNKFRNDRVAFQKALEEEGLTFDEWRAELRAQIIVSVMRDREVDSKVAVSPREVREAYERDIARYRVPEQVELRMIRISRGRTPEELEVKRRQMEDVRRRILAGEDFGAVAQAVSEGTKASVGGYWGWVEPESRREELAEAMACLEPGEVSDLVETEEDLYLIRIEARREEHVIPFETVRDEIQETLRKERAKILYDEWMQRLKKRAFIRKF